MGIKTSIGKGRTLMLVCALLGISVVSCLLDMHHVLTHINNNMIVFADALVAITSALNVLVRVSIIFLGVKLHRTVSQEEKLDTSDQVNQCQSLAIAAAGMAAIDWIVDSLADNAIDVADLMWTLCAIILVAVFYHIVGRTEHSTFWEGVRTTPHLEPYIAVGDVASEFTIDAQSGRLRPIRPGETSCVTVLTPDEYLKRTPAHVLQQVMHSLNNVRRSSCVQLGDLVFGNVYIPKDVQRAAGFDAKSSLGFSYELDGDNLTIIMEEEDQGEERAFLALSLVDQYLDKSTPVSFIPEMIVMLAMRISVWIREYEDRLATLESNLNGDVYEMPKGLSEFLSNARRELGTIEGFCRQTGDMLEDITRIASSRGNERASVNCAAISRQIARLALDAGEVREYAGEIRASFQERIEVRQNNVMSLLTIVETVFTPLALVTGWYGMNFVNMPELKHPDAYFIVVAVLVFFIVLEFSIFKRRRWF